LNCTVSVEGWKKKRKENAPQGSSEKKGGGEGKSPFPQAQITGRKRKGGEKEEKEMILFHTHI